MTKSLGLSTEPAHNAARRGWVSGPGEPPASPAGRCALSAEPAHNAARRGWVSGPGEPPASPAGRCALSAEPAHNAARRGWVSGPGERPASPAGRCALVLVLAAAALGASGVHEFTMKAIDGKPVPLAQFKGQVLLIVN